MNTSELSDYQLYEIIQNKKLHNHVRILANKEFNKRNLSISELKEIVLKYESIDGSGGHDSVTAKPKWKPYLLYASVSVIAWIIAWFTLIKK